MNEFIEGQAAAFRECTDYAERAFVNTEGSGRFAPLDSPERAFSGDGQPEAGVQGKPLAIMSTVELGERVEQMGTGGVSREVYDALLRAGALDPDIDHLFAGCRDPTQGSDIGASEVQATMGDLEVRMTETDVRVVDSEGSVLVTVRPEEYKILVDSGLSPEMFNGRLTFVRVDIDPNYKDAMGHPNSQRMSEGKPPLDYSTGRPIELHHVGQQKDGALAELRMEEHRTPPNNSILHPNRNGSEVEHGNEWNQQRAEHWKARAESMGVDS